MVVPTGGGVLLLLAASMMWPAGCSPEKRYRVLSFFFDGVPDPAEAAAIASGASLTAPPAARR